MSNMETTPPLPEAAGLREATARDLLAREGPNELPAAATRNAWSLLRHVVLEPMFLLLVACGVIYLVLGDQREALMLLGFVFVVMGISYAQQRRAERSLDALRDLSSPRALVVRDGTSRRIAGRELVRGDVVLLAEGDRVPADLLLLRVSNLALDESLLTGESLPLDKHAAPPTAGLEAPGEHERESLAHAGSLVTRGTALGRVIATGEHSALGRIGKSLAGIGGGSTPLQLEIEQVVTRIATVGLLLACSLAVAYGYQRGDWLNGVLAGLTLAMAVLPEELPVILTLFLGLGAWRLARENVLTRSMPAVELLGATTVLCVDKTGTLTENRMVVRQLWSAAETFDVATSTGTALPEALHATLEYAVLASHRRAFDPMEAAISSAGQALLADTGHLHADWTLVDDYPLTSDLLAMSRVWQAPDSDARLIAAKGAPEAVIDLCHLPQVEREAILAQVDTMARQGLRVLGVGQARFGAAALPTGQHDFAFEFLGLLGLEDPVREDVPRAIAECHAAGIRVVMMTGDHPTTAVAIARAAGLPVDAPPISGTELAVLDDDALAAQLGQTSIYCRVQPEQKLRLVEAFRSAGEVVAMTGDGVNDAPALKAADIGVAMGARGTDVAREAAALVLLNDDFASIVVAVRYGRRVFVNLRKAIVFVVAVHMPIIGLSILPVILGWPLLLMPVHILFLQLIIDPACAIVFEAEPSEATAMSSPPRAPTVRLFDRAVLARGLWQGLGLTALLIAVYLLGERLTGSSTMARTLTFTVLVLSNLALIFVNRAWDGPAWRSRAAPNPYFPWIAVATLGLLGAVLGFPALAQVFSFERPPLPLLLGALAASGLGLCWFETVKWALAKSGKAST